MPPRISPQIVTQASLDAGESTCFADFAHFPDTAGSNESSNSSTTRQPITNNHHVEGQPSITPRSITSLQSTLRSSAFEVYRKPAVTPGGFHSPNETQSTVYNNSTTTANHSGQQQQPHHTLHAANSSSSTNSSNTSDFEKRVSAINDSLRYVSFKQSERNVSDVMHHLREQNQLLLRLCSDLTDELASVHRKKEELRGKIDEQPSATATAAPSTTNNNPSLHHSIV